MKIISDMCCSLTIVYWRINIRDYNDNKCVHRNEIFRIIYFLNYLIREFITYNYYSLYNNLIF